LVVFGVDNDNNNDINDVYCAIIIDKAIARVHSGHSNECWPATGGRQLVGQAANLTFESASRLPLAKN